MKVFNYLLVLNFIAISIVILVIYNFGIREDWQFYLIISLLLIQSYLCINFNSKELKNWVSLKKECEIIEKKIKMKELEKELKN